MAKNWAQETGFTDNFWGKLVEEAWAVIRPKQLDTAQFQAGIDLDKLDADYKQLTGSDLLITPTPAPTLSPGCFPAALSRIIGIFSK